MDIKCLVILNCFCILILCFHPFVEGNAPYGKCADPACSELVGTGITLMAYPSPDNSRISVQPNEEVLIFVREYGPKKDQLGVIVRGTRGYINKNFIKELKTFKKDLVPAEFPFVPVAQSHTGTSQEHTSSHIETISQSVGYSQVHPQDHSSGSVITNPGIMNNIHISGSLQTPVPSINQENMHNYPSQQGVSGHMLQSAQQYSHPGMSSNILPSMNEFNNLHTESLYPSPSPMPEIHQSQVSGGYAVHSSGSNFYPGNTAPYSDPHLMHHQSNFLHQQFMSPGIYESQSHFRQESLEVVDEDMSKTYAMLENRGLHSTDVFQSESSFHLSESDMNNLYLTESFISNQIDHSGTFDSIDSLTVESIESELNSLNHDTLVNTYSAPESSIHISQSVNNQQNTESVKAQVSSYKTDISSSETFDSTVSNDNSLEQELTSIVSDRSGKGKRKSAVVDKMNKMLESFLDDLDFDDENSLEDDEKIESIPADTETVTAVKIDVPANSEKVSDSPEYKKIPSDSPKLSEESLDLKGSLTSKDVISSSIDTTMNVQETSQTSINSHLKSESVASSSVDTAIKVQETSQPGINSHLQSESSSLTNFETVPTKTNQIPESSKIGKDLQYSDVLLKTDANSLEANDTIVTKNDESTLNNVNIDVKNLDAVETDEPLVKKSVQSHKSIPSPDTKLHLNEESLLKTSIDPGKSDLNENLQDDSLLKKSLYEEGSGKTNLLDNPDLFVTESTDTYQIRNLKGEYETQDESQSDSEVIDENSTHAADNFNPFENGLGALKAFVDSVILWFPEPFYSAVMDMQTKGISPRVPVFTFICGVLCVILITALGFIEKFSKERDLNVKLASVEQKVYNMSAANLALEEKLEITLDELNSVKEALLEERKVNGDMNIEVQNYADEFKILKYDLEKSLKEIESLTQKEKEQSFIIEEYEKEKAVYLEQISDYVERIRALEDLNSGLTDELEESENKVEQLSKEKMQYDELTEEYKEKISQFEQNCNQLLQEAEVWNLRVNELTSKLKDEETVREELLSTLKEKDGEIESLKQLVEAFVPVEESDISEEEKTKLKEEKVQLFMDASAISIKLNNKEEENKILVQKLSEEQNKLLEREVELLDAKSEIDKLKINYNQALQDKTEAQTKLEVLTNYFKDKEIQLQKQLGVHEAYRQKNEEDVSSAERRICLIEQENASYKFQVASMKQEMEETERNLKSQIAVQEKKAHENWIAARAAERKLDDMKQEVTQLRQRLTLLEREQENWVNSSRDGIVKPVPKRMPLEMDESGNQDASISDMQQGIFHPHLLPERLPPFLLPSDRPLPPLFPPPPPFMGPPMERPFRPWPMPPNPSSDFRTTPPEFVTGRESTPPRGRHSAVIEGEGPHASSPLTTETRDSRNSTPPHLLPNFHDLPPQPGRPFHPPPLGHPRLPMHPSFRRDLGPGPKRTDGSGDLSSRSQHPPPHDQWAQSNSSRV